MQKRWQTELADQFEGGVSEDRALLDITRGVIQNLYHENIGLWGSATPKNTTGDLSFTKTGIVAFDRVKNLPWKDYNPIAKGEEVITPHVGNVDTIQIPINQKRYTALELMDTDLARMKNDPIYRAQLVGSIARTLSSTLDSELFDLLIAAAAGKKDAVIEVDFPKKFDPNKIELDLERADIVTEIEKTINAYYIGIPRNQIVIVMDPKLYSRYIRGITGAQMVVESNILSWIQNEQIQASKVSGITIIRHPFLDNNVIADASSTFGRYNFKGVRAIIYHIAAPWIVQVFNNINGVINKDTGNYRMIQRLIAGKGLIYGDLIRVIKDPSTKTDPLPWEMNLVDNRTKYNDSYGFKDWGIEIPSTVESLQAKYRKLSTSTTEEDNSTRNGSKEVEEGKSKGEKELIAPGNSVEYRTTDWYGEGEKGQRYLGLTFIGKGWTQEMPGYALVEIETILKKDMRISREFDRTKSEEYSSEETSNSGGGTLTFTKKNYMKFRLVKRED